MLILRRIFNYIGSLGSKWLKTFTRTDFICSSLENNFWSISECYSCKKVFLRSTVFLSRALNICLRQEFSSLLTNITLIKLFPCYHSTENSKTKENNYSSHPQMVRHGSYWDFRDFERKAQYHLLQSERHIHLEGKAGEWACS